MRVLVPGGAGYIGSHACRKLCDLGYEVVVIDNLETGYEWAVDNRTIFYKGDIRDRNLMEEVFSKEHIDCVIHFAANLSVAESMTNPLKYYDNNVFGTQVLLETMIRHNVNKIIFSSTAAVYGDVQEYPVTEDFPTNPINSYGETKLAMEKMMKWASLSHGLKYIALRYFNVAGAHPSGEIGEAHPSKVNLIPIILQTAQGVRDHMNLYGTDYPTKDGTCIRDYIHVEDLVDAHILAMENLLNGGESDVFNLGTGTGYTVLEMIESAKRVTGKEVNVINVGRRDGDSVAVVASSEKACRVLGWKPKHLNIDDTISSSWNFRKKLHNRSSTYYYF